VLTALTRGAWNVKHFPQADEKSSPLTLSFSLGFSWFIAEILACDLRIHAAATLNGKHYPGYEVDF